MKTILQLLRRLDPKSEYDTTVGYGIVSVGKGVPYDVLVEGRFRFFGWTFMVHRDPNNPELYAVSEAKTGANISCYGCATPEKAVREAVNVLWRRRYMLHTSIMDVVVGRRIDFEAKNRGLSLGIDVMTWNL